MTDDETAPPHEPAPPATGRPTTSRTVTAVVGVLALALGLAAGMVAGARFLAPDASTTAGAAGSGAGPGSPAGSPPGADSVDVGFARDMKTHHAQAVELSTLLRERTEDPRIRTVALDIALTQQQQIGQMYAWLDLWGHPQSAGKSTMRWMSGDDEGSGSRADGDRDGDRDGDGANGGGDPGGMPGMATQRQLDALADSRGREAEVRFLRLMIEHHRGGVTMAREAVERATVPDVRRLARTMVDAQQAEIDAMREMLRDRRR